MKRGRPSSYTAEIADRICDELASGKSLVKICRASGMPNCATVFRWLQDPEREDFRERYARARDAQADFYAAEITEISDKCRTGVKTEREQVGWVCPKCDQSVKWLGQKWMHVIGKETSPLCEGVKKPDPVYKEKTSTGDMVERSKLMVDARKWLASKLAPKKYGDKLQAELSGMDGGPVQHNITVKYVTSDGN